MKNEERNIELLTEMVMKKDVFVNKLREVKYIQQRQEKHVEKMLEILSDDVPRF